MNDNHNKDIKSQISVDIKNNDKIPSSKEKIKKKEPPPPEIVQNNANTVCLCFTCCHIQTCHCCCDNCNSCCSRFTECFCDCLRGSIKKCYDYHCCLCKGFVSCCQKCFEDFFIECCSKFCEIFFKAICFCCFCMCCCLR